MDEEGRARPCDIVNHLTLVKSLSDLRDTDV